MSNDASIPEFMTAVTTLRSGETVTFRLLRSEESVRFGRYLLGLSPETTARYGPHRFDQETADAICAGLANDDILRMIATVADGDDERIIGYFLLKQGVHEGDTVRYARLGIPLFPESDATIAPSITDEYQNAGVGSLMMRHILEVTKQLGRRRIVLWGGVQAPNERAVHFYTKWGFRKVGEFYTDKNNHDMILDLFPE